MSACYNCYSQRLIEYTSTDIEVLKKLIGCEGVENLYIRKDTNGNYILVQCQNCKRIQ